MYVPHRSLDLAQSFQEGAVVKAVAAAAYNILSTVTVGVTHVVVTDLGHGLVTVQVIVPHR